MDWSVTSDILLNSKKTNSPDFVFLGILLAIPSGRLHHTFYLPLPSPSRPLLSANFSSTGVRERFISCFRDANHRDCVVHRLKITGNSISNSVQIVQRFFPPLMQTNFHLVEAKQDNSPWMSRQHGWCDYLFHFVPVILIQSCISGWK